MEKNRKMMQTEKRLTDEAELLDQYLSQYKFCIGRKKTLENRRGEIKKDFDSPLKAVRMNGMPRGSGNLAGCAALSFLLDEIDSLIKEQIEISAKILANIMNMINFLPNNSLERSIIESKYIEFHGWNWICSENHISRSPAIRKWRKGLYMLLEFEEVKQILKEYQDEQEKD